MMEYLNATDLSTFCYVSGVNLTSRERENYLLPIRDLPTQEEWIKSCIAHGNRLTIVGKNIPLWFARVRHPREYWWGRKSHVTIRVWLVIPPNARDVSVRQARIDSIEAIFFDDWTQDMHPSREDIERWNQGNLLREPDKISREQLRLVRPPGSCLEKLAFRLSVYICLV